MKARSIFSGILSIIVAVSLAGAVILGYLNFRLEDAEGMKKAANNEQLVQVTLQSVKDNLESYALFVSLSEIDEVVGFIEETEVRRLVGENAEKLVQSIYSGVEYVPSKLADDYFRPLTDRLLDGYAERTGISMLESEYNNIPLAFANSVSRDVAIINISSLNGILQGGYYGLVLKYLSLAFYAVCALFALSLILLVAVLWGHWKKLWRFGVHALWFGSMTALVPSVVLIFINLPDRLNVGHSALKMFTDGLIRYVTDYMYIIPAVLAVIATLIIGFYIYNREKGKKNTPAKVEETVNV